MAWRKAEVNEALVTLYLRLNGYFTTGLVVQSPQWGQARTEIDCFAVRFPYHSQPDRGVPSAPFLALRPRLIDILICEVKSLPAEAAFNQRLRKEPAALEYALGWGGFFAKKAVPKVARELQPLLQHAVTRTQARRGVLHAGVRVRGLLSCPPASEGDLPDRWCLVGTEILRFTHECFNPPAPRDACSTRYNFNLWGGHLAPMVQYFKGLASTETPTLDGVYKHVGAV